MARSNFSFEKRRKELEKQKKKEAKRQAKAERKAAAEAGELPPEPVVQFDKFGQAIPVGASDAPDEDPSEEDDTTEENDPA